MAEPCRLEVQIGVHPEDMGAAERGISSACSLISWSPRTPAGGYARWVLAVKTRACLGSDSGAVADPQSKES